MPKLIAIAFWSERMFTDSPTNEARQNFSREIFCQQDLREGVDGLGGAPNLIHFIEPLGTKENVLLEGRDWVRREHAESDFETVMKFFPKEPKE